MRVFNLTLNAIFKAHLPLKSLSLVLGILFALSHSVFSQNQTKEYYQTKLKANTTIGYLSYLPPAYNKNKSEELPLMIFLHGLGERGSNLDQLFYYGPPQMIKYGKWDEDLPFIIISPQSPTSFGGTWNPDLVDEVIDQVVARYRVDKSRIYVTGTSMGGNGTWNYATKYPDRVAAIVPICGWGTPKDACNLKNVPVWAFHNQGDATVNVSGTNNMIDALNKCSPSPQPKKVIYPVSGHNAWTQTYNLSAGHDIYKWMLSHKKGGSTSNKNPNVNAGSDKSITLPQNSLTLSGSASDPDGTIASYSWSKVSGPAATLANANTVNLKLSNLVAGVYVFKLTVKDNKGATASDEVKVTVSTAANKGPIANAGGNKTLTLPNNSITLTGSGQDSDGSIASYQWSKVSGPSATLTDANKPSLKLSNLIEGTYTFRLTVKDNQNASASDDVTLVVKSAAHTGGGLSYAYYEGSWTDVPDFSKLNPIKTGTVANFDLTPAIKKDYFGFVFEGSIQISKSGEYTFYAASDDGNHLYINNKKVIDNGGMHSRVEKSGKVHLEAGVHQIKVTYFERTGNEILEVRYSGPGISKQLIPDNILGEAVVDDVEDSTPSLPPGNPAPSNGLSYAYYEGNWYDVPDFSKLTPIKTGTVANFDLTPAIKKDYFGFVFEGSIQISKSGEYTFYAASDDGNHLYINNKRIIDNGGMHSRVEKSGKVHLEAGVHQIKVTYFERTGNEILEVRYSGPGISKQLIPDNILGEAVMDDVEDSTPSLPPGNPAPSNGLSYAYYEGNWYDVPDFSKLTPIKTGTVANFDLTPAIKKDYFGFVFEGSIQISKSGEYTFYAASDDGNHLYINNKRIIDNGGMHSRVEKSGKVHLDAGTHQIKVTYFERAGNEVLEVRYAGPGISKQLIPNSILGNKENGGATTPPKSNEVDLVNGLSYAYYEGSWYDVPDFSKLTAKKTGTVANFDLKPAINKDYFGFVFEGSIQIEKSGEYTFYTASDDGNKLYINNKEIIDNGGMHARQEKSGKIYLEEGYHPIKVTYFERTGNEVLEVRYSGSGISKQFIPNDILFRPTNDKSMSDSQKNMAFAKALTSEHSSTQAYPNPFVDYVNVSLVGNDRYEGTINIVLINMIGETVYSEQVYSNSAEQSLEIATAHLNKGIYFLQIIKGTEKEVIRLIKN